MSGAESKESTIKKVYENAASGYGSIRDTYIQANKINPGIRYVDVKEYLDKQQHRQPGLNIKGLTRVFHHTPYLKSKLILSLIHI